MSGGFIDYVTELLAPLGPIRARRMFGGYGIYCHDAFFALVADDVFYVKTNDHNRPAFEARGIRPFKPFDDKPMVMPYYPVPEEYLEDSDALLIWARGGLDAALREQAAKPAKRKRRKTPAA